MILDRRSRCVSRQAQETIVENVLSNCEICMHDVILWNKANHLWKIYDSALFAIDLDCTTDVAVAGTAAESIHEGGFPSTAWPHQCYQGGCRKGPCDVIEYALTICLQMH